MKRSVGQLLVMLAAITGCSGKSHDVTVNVSTPADVGRTLCAILENERIDLLDKVLPWTQQVAACNAILNGRGSYAKGILPCRKAEGSGAADGSEAASGSADGESADATFANCTEEALIADWKALAAAVKR